MKKVFVMENLDCANCAAKMEDAVRKIPGVSYGTADDAGGRRCRIRRDRQKGAKGVRTRGRRLLRYSEVIRITRQPEFTALSGPEGD